MARPVRIAVVGIDGTGKTSAVNHLARILSKKRRVQVITMAPREETMRTKTGKRITGFLEKMNKKSDKTKDKLYVGISQVIMNKLLPWVRLAKERNSDIVIYERHPRIDYKVYGDYYLTRGISRIEEHLSGIPKPDIVVYLDADSEIAIKRILARQKKENRFLHPHEENVELLKMAKDRFNKVLGELEVSGIKIIRIDANKPLKDMLKEVEIKVKRELKTRGR